MNDYTGSGKGGGVDRRVHQKHGSPQWCVPGAKEHSLTRLVASSTRLVHRSGVHVRLHEGEAWMVVRHATHAAVHHYINMDGPQAASAASLTAGGGGGKAGSWEGWGCNDGKPKAVSALCTETKLNQERNAPLPEPG